MKAEQRAYIDAFAAWARAYFDASRSPTQPSIDRLVLARDAYDVANRRYRAAIFAATGRSVS